MPFVSPVIPIPDLNDQKMIASVPAQLPGSYAIAFDLKIPAAEVPALETRVVNIIAGFLELEA